MKNKIRIIKAVVAASLCTLNACGIFAATGDAVSAVGEGAGDAVVGIGEGAGAAVSGTGRAIRRGANATQDELNN